MKRNHSTKRKTNHQHGTVSFATKSCIAHPRRAVVGHFDPSAEPRVPCLNRRQARTGARMWPAHKSRAGSRNQSHVVCTCDLTLPGRCVVKFCIAVIMSPALATRGLNKACSNLPNSQISSSLQKFAWRGSASRKLKRRSSIVLHFSQGASVGPVSGSHRGAVRAASAHAVRQTGSQQQALQSADDFWLWPLTGMHQLRRRGGLPVARPWRLQGANLM
jgi:hypothetical protein